MLITPTFQVYLGDVFNNAGYPFIDAGNGGSLDGLNDEGTDVSGGQRTHRVNLDDSFERLSPHR